MALTAQHKDVDFGVGDKIRVIQMIKEGDKSRLQSFEGVVLGIRGRNENRTFTVRRIGAAQIGIERIFPLVSPTIQKIEVVRKGLRGVRRAKLFFLRDKSRRDLEKIYSRSAKREQIKKKGHISEAKAITKRSKGSKKRNTKTKKVDKVKSS